MTQSLAFRRNSHQLYTASYDRSVKLFDLSPTVMGYVETLFGHQDSISCIDVLKRETAVTCGGRDKSVRFWKVVEESQLVFRGGGKSRLREVLEGGAEDADEEANEPNKAAKSGESKQFIEGSIDCVAMVDENTFVSGGDSGCVFLMTCGMHIIC
jgi:ribosomal RNA-processing protein 9